MDLSRYRSSPVIIAMLLAGNALGSQAWYSPITINHAQVGGASQTDFPVLISQTDNRFKTIGNGGHVANSNGYDIRPYTDSALSTAITGYELERYNSSTGEVVMWVKIASLGGVSGGSDTVIYLGYGDTGLTTDGSSTSTWSNNFVDVYHLKDGTTLSVADSVGAHNGTNVNTVTATTGQIDGAGGFASASSQYVDTNSSAGNAALTYSAWVKATTLPAAYNATFFQNPNNAVFNGILVKSNGKLLGAVSTAGGQLSFDGTGSHTLSTGTWYYLTLSYNSSAGLIAYVNAASDQTVAASGTAGATGANVYIGRDQINGRYWNGAIDEIRLSSVARSADWITTEYNNQNAPGTFETLGTEVGLSVAATGWFNFIP